MEQHFSEPEKLQRQLTILNQIAKALTSSLTIDEVLKKVFYKVAEVFNPENWSLLLLDEDTDELYFEIVVGEAAPSIKDIRIKVGEGIAGWVASTGTPLLVPEVHKDPRFSKKVDEISAFETSSLICIPLRVRDKVMGVIELVNAKSLFPLAQYELDNLSAIADYTAIALENARNFEHVHRLTVTDDLSGLYNSRHLHTLLQEHIEAYYKAGKKFSIIFFDLDHFKSVNDTYGHLMGSKLLTEVGVFLRENLRPADSAARYGGDEFVVILPATDKKGAVAFCETLRDAMNKRPFCRDEGYDIKLTASFGLATFPDDADCKDRLLTKADTCMYRVKADNRNSIAF
ncbi:MAG: sensor domain-containing diguanylate cyclase [bacterium]|nr:sensor domain-containing diguanylate cyclase [bacterium]